jgi:hypothetical protein
MVSGLAVKQLMMPDGFLPGVGAAGPVENPSNSLPY